MRWRLVYARGGGTPAMRLRLRERPVPIQDLLHGRLFPERVGLSSEWAPYYRGEMVTLCLARERRHRLRLAA